MIEDELTQDCRAAFDELFYEQDEIERERKNIYRNQEDTEYEYRRKLFSLTNEGRTRVMKFIPQPSNKA